MGPDTKCLFSLDNVDIFYQIVLIEDLSFSLNNNESIQREVIHSPKNSKFSILVGLVL